MKKLPLLLLAVSMLCACGRQKLPEGVLDNESMTAFLTEAYTLESYNAIRSKSDNDSLSADVRAAYDEILRRNGITKEEVEASLEYYGNHPDEYRTILDEVAKRLDSNVEAN